MDDNLTLRMDPETYDLSFDEDGIMETISGDDTTAQCVRLTLLAWKSEFPLDEAHGTDYARFLGVPKNELDPDIPREVLREAIYQEEAVTQIEALSIDTEDREMHVAFTGTLENGRTISVEVNR